MSRVGTFSTTHWSVVLSAANQESTEATEALEQLCGQYWYPIYAYVRWRGHNPDDARDLTQEFFLRLLQKEYLAQVDPTKGRFRSFLMVAVNHFLSNEWQRAHTLKRGSAFTFVSLEENAAEKKYQDEPVTNASPERLYEQRWALTLLEQVLTRFRGEFVTTSKGDWFDPLKKLLLRENSGSYAALAAQLGTTEGALKMTVCRMRQRYAELIREEIAQTVSSPDEVEDEIRYLLSIVGG